MKIGGKVLFHQIFLAVVDVKTSCGRFAVQSASVQRVPDIILNGCGSLYMLYASSLTSNLEVVGVEV